MNEFTNYSEVSKKPGLNKDALMFMAMTGSMSGDQMGGMNPMAMAMMFGGGFGGNGFDIGSKINGNPFLKNIMPTEVENAGMSFNGDIIIDGYAVKFDDNNRASFVDSLGLQMEIPALAVPTKSTDIKAGDIVFFGNEAVAVQAIDAEKLTGVTIGKTEMTTRLIASDIMGTSNIRKLYNPFGNGDGLSPFAAMFLMG